MNDESKIKYFGGPKELRIGDVVQFGGEKIVVKVNQSRAVITNVKKQKVAFQDSRSGKEVEFERIGSDAESISPRSEIPILRRTGMAGLEYWKQNKELPG